jgi:hypothetical protein
VTDSMSGELASKAETAEVLRGLSEVARMATLLAGDVLDAQIMGRPIPDSHIRPTLEASLLLKEYGVDVPPLLSQIMHEVENPRAEPQRDAQQRGAEAEEAGRFPRLFQPFRGAKS